MSAGLVAALKFLLLPPGANLALAAVALALWRRRRNLAMGFLIASLLVLYLLAAPGVARPLAGLLEGRWLSAAAASPDGAGAIVIPGCDRYANAPEHGGEDDVSACTLVRLKRAAELHRSSGLPVLVSGGRVFGERQAEAELMARALRESFGIEARWIESGSRNTAENATFSARMLTADGVSRVALVTHALHMTRAARSFRRRGIEVIAAPSHFQSAPDARPAWLAFLPSATALSISGAALYELLGNLYYLATGK